MRGTVVDFDDQVGLGTVECDGVERYRFHCVEIADGTRHIEIGAQVDFDRAAGQLGVWEAVRVRPVRAAPG